MKKPLTLIVLLLFVLAACSAPATESVTELLPGSDEPAPTEAAVIAEEPATDEAANEEEPEPTCDPTELPEPEEGQVMIRFLNLSDEEVVGSWHDTGQSPTVLSEYFQLEDRHTFDQATFTGHEWVLKSEEGHMLLDYVASAEAKQCVVIYPHFEYGGADETEEWAELSDHYETCGSGQQQSPINLTNATATDLENIGFEYGETAVNIINNGHTIQVNAVPGSHIVVGDETYQLLQFHFHAPSEHVVDGKGYPLEMHLVHRGANNALAVVGIFIAEGAENTAFTPVWEALPEEEIGIIATGATIDLTSLLPAEQTVYHYTGSLTTPPCSEEVTWLVMKTPVEMSAEQIAAFTEIVDGNNRLPQPLHARSLQLDSTP